MVAFQLRLCHVGHCSTFLVTSKFGKDTTKAKRHIFQYVDYNHLPPNEQKRGTIIRGFRPHPWFQVDHRFQVMCFPGTEELYDEILDRLRNIPDAELRVAKGLVAGQVNDGQCVIVINH